MSSPIYFQSLEEKTKEAIIEELRYYFQTISQFGTPGSTVKMPMIREAYGTNLRNYPAVFVKITNSTFQTLGINQGFVADIFSDDQEIYQQYLPGTENNRYPIPYRPRVIAERYGYLGDVSFALEIWGDTVPVRNRMSDEITSAFMRFQRERLLDKGIQLVSISRGADADFPLNETTHIYISNIHLVVNAELYFDYPVPSITGIEVTSKTTSPLYPDLQDGIIQNQFESI